MRLGLLPGPPLVPGGDEARDSLRRELLKPEYRRQDTLRQVLDWVQRRLQGGLDSARATPPLSALAAMLVFVVLVIALVALVSRLRRTATAARQPGAVLTAEVVTAAQLRARARSALAEGRFGVAVLEAFRALTLQQAERGLLVDSPGATAREVAVAIGAELPGIAPRVEQAARTFDAVRYGGRTATSEEAAQVVGLDTELALRRGALR